MGRLLGFAKEKMNAAKAASALDNITVTTTEQLETCRDSNNVGESVSDSAIRRQ